jgi:dihydrofolate reductase
MIIFVAAYSQGKAMGKDGHLPWRHARMQHDTEHLHQLIHGKSLVMGFKTYHDYADVQKTFQAKDVTVLSRNEVDLLGASVVHSIESIVNRGKKEDLWVIGGGEVFFQLLPFAQKMHLTEIAADLAGDVFFPEYSLEEWNIVQRSHYAADANNPFAYTFLELQRVV